MCVQVGFQLLQHPYWSSAEVKSLHGEEWGHTTSFYLRFKAAPTHTRTLTHPFGLHVVVFLDVRYSVFLLVQVKGVTHYIYIYRHIFLKGTPTDLHAYKIPPPPTHTQRPTSIPTQTPTHKGDLNQISGGFSTVLTVSSWAMKTHCIWTPSPHRNRHTRNKHTANTIHTHTHCTHTVYVLMSAPHTRIMPISHPVMIHSSNDCLSSLRSLLLPSI